MTNKGVEEFFGAIKERCSSDDEYAVELLKARGFLLEDEELALSDNSLLPEDVDYLNQILRRGNLGEIKDGKIILFPDGNMEEIFFMDNKIGITASLDKDDGWEKFIHYTYVPKVSVGILEPFVARYIKAISACGIGTWYSCDGNHPEKKPPHEIIIDFVSEPHRLWHEIICTSYLSQRVSLDWDASYSRIRITNKNKWRTYIELNKAAEILYNSRIELRRIKHEASCSISNSMALHLPAEELAAIFSNKANDLMLTELLVEATVCEEPQQKEALWEQVGDLVLKVYQNPNPITPEEETHNER